MAIKSGVGLAPVDVQTSSTIVLFTPSAVDRISCEAMSLHNTSATTVTVTVLEGSTQIEVIKVYPGERVDAFSVIGQGFSALNVTMSASSTGVTANATITQYTDGS